jgi:folate-binding protein YgfZ
MTGTDDHLEEVLGALGRGAAWIERTGRYRLSFRGPDRAKSLHNLTTNDVKGLLAGSGREAFVTSPQGKTLAFATLLATDDTIWLLTDAASRGSLESHLAKYTVLDEVECSDRTAETVEIHVAGPGAFALLGVEPGDDLSHIGLTIAGAPVVVFRESPIGVSGLTVLADAGNRDRILSAVGSAIELTTEEFESLRIAAGTPASGRDVTEKNLPQEVDRDQRAIHFTKGCYLGQETVARLDALGHVNRLLRGLVLEGDALPEPGTALRAGGKDAGHVTTAARSIRTGRPIALAYVRTAFLASGTELDAGAAKAVVSSLPIEG